MISQRARFALQAIVALVHAKPGRVLNICELCEQDKLPRKFIEKILSSLRPEEYISSRREREGGDETMTQQITSELYRNVPVLDKGASGSTTTLA